MQSTRTQGQARAVRLWIGVALVCATMALSTASASAQYVDAPGNTPTVTDNFAPSQDPPDVAGVQFGRQASTTNASDSFNLLELLWLWLLLALTLGLFFLFFWRRRRDEEEDDDAFAGAQPA